MVKCSRCGAENQPEAVYCANCSIPIHKGQIESLSAAYRARVVFLAGMVLGVLLMGVGLVMSQMAADLGMAGSEAIGYSILVLGILVIILSLFYTGRFRL